MKKSLKAVFNRYTLCGTLMLGMLSGDSQQIQFIPDAAAAPYTQDLSSHVPAAPHSPFIPADAIPPYLKHFYDKMGDIHNRPRSDKPVNTLGRNFNLSGHFKPGESKNADTLGSLTPAKAEDKAKDFLRSKTYRSLRNSDHDIWLKETLPAVEALRHGGISGSEARRIVRFLKFYDAPQSYMRWEDRKRDEIMRDLAQNNRLQNLLNRWQDVDDYDRDHNRMMEQYAIKQESLQIIADTARRAFGYDPIPVIIDEIPDDLALWGVYTKTKAPGAPGGTDKVHEFILISHDLIEESGERPSDRLLDIMFEEVKHSIDSAMANDLVRGKIGTVDVRFAHAAAFIINAQTYSIPDQDACKSRAHFMKRRCEDSIENYLEQYNERTAKTFAKQARNMFKDDVRSMPMLVDGDARLTLSA